MAKVIVIAATNRLVSELKAAGLIHPHSGQEELLRSELGKFAAELGAEPVQPALVSAGTLGGQPYALSTDIAPGLVVMHPETLAKYEERGAPVVVFGPEDAADLGTGVGEPEPNRAPDSGSEELKADGPHTPITLVDDKPSAADLDAVAEEQVAKDATAAPEQEDTHADEIADAENNHGAGPIDETPALEGEAPVAD